MGLFLQNLKAKIANLNFKSRFYSVKYSVKNFLLSLIHRRSPVAPNISGVPGLSRLPKKFVFVSLSVLAIIIVAGLIFVVVRTRKNSTATSAAAQVAISGPKATLVLNKEFDFPLTDSKGKEVGSFKYIIQSIDLRDEIVVKGQKATAIQGKTFLVINLKIVNEFNQAVQINTKDYVRLALNGNANEWLAPEIHNDPVEVQAISTKLTRVGLAVNNSDHDLILRVGEINGTKTDLPIKFN